MTMNNVPSEENPRTGRVIRLEHPGVRQGSPPGRADRQRKLNRSWRSSLFAMRKGSTAEAKEIMEKPSISRKSTVNGLGCAVIGQSLLAAAHLSTKH